MDYNLCTISFRSELVSFDELIRFARDVGFGGIELWGVHARSILERHPMGIDGLLEQLHRAGLRIPMISDYADLLAPADRFRQTERAWIASLDAARRFGAERIRVFAGSRGSGEADAGEWQLCAARLRRLADLSAIHGMTLLVETHPGTLADTLPSTLRLLEQTDRESIGVNLDFYHLWESGASPFDAYLALRPRVGHIHLKNADAGADAKLFAPANVFAPNGMREGMSLLGEGAIDYAETIRLLLETDYAHGVSLEWFGPQPFHNLGREMAWLLETECRLRSSLTEDKPPLRV